MNGCEEDFKSLNNAVMFRDLKRVKYLVETRKIDVNIRCIYEKNVLYDLGKMGHLIFELECQKKFAHFADKSNLINLLIYLLEQGIDINIQARDGMNILLWFSIHGFIEIIKILFQYNVSHNVYNISYINMNYISSNNYMGNDLYTITGYYPIHFAVMQGHYAIVKYFLTHNVDVNLISVNIYGKNPLHIAILHSHYDILKLLLTYGADYTKSMNFNYTPLSLALYANHFLSYKLNVRYDLQIITKLLELGCKDDLNANSIVNINVNYDTKLFSSYLEAAKFLMNDKINNNYNVNCSIETIMIIFNYAIKYQILSLAINVLCILKDNPSQYYIYTEFKEILRQSNFSSQFDGGVIACKYGLKGHANTKIPYDVANHIIGFCYGNFNVNDRGSNKIHNRIATIYSYNNKKRINSISSDAKATILKPKNNLIYNALANKCKLQ